MAIEMLYSLTLTEASGKYLISTLVTGIYLRGVVAG